jgi:predicted phosphoadenosine phosphosulfate sulfurtransferase
MTRKTYTLKIPRFQPFKNIRVVNGVEEKQCTKCFLWKVISYENWCKDSQRESGYKSQCRQCGYDYYKNRKLNESKSTNGLSYGLI